MDGWYISGKGLASLLDIWFSFCFGRSHDEIATGVDGPRRSGGGGRNGIAFGGILGGGALGRVDERAPLPEERADGGRAVALCGRISRSVAGAAGMVGGCVSSERPRRLDRLGRKSTARTAASGGQQRAFLPTGGAGAVSEF